MTSAFSSVCGWQRAGSGTLFGCVFWLGSSSLGAAEDAETRTAARDLATQGAQAFDAGQYREASDFFGRAYELVHAPSIALLEARSLAKLGRLLEASDIYEQTAHYKLNADSPEAYSQAVQTARDELEEVHKRLARLKLSLLGVAANDVPEVTMDDKVTPAALVGVERPVNPGAHRISVRILGRLKAARDVNLVEGQSYQIALDVRYDQQSNPALREQNPKRAASDAPLGRTLGYVSLGVGALGLGLGTYTGVLALHRKSELDSACRPACPASSADELSSFRSNRTLSWISYGVGFAAAATGVVLLTVGKPAHEQFVLRALPGGLRLQGSL